jgi:hypothetical protein
MPWMSRAQQKWGNSPSGHRALGDSGVNEWNSATKGKSLPKRVAKKPEPKNTAPRSAVSVMLGG